MVYERKLFDDLYRWSVAEPQHRVWATDGAQMYTDNTSTIGCTEQTWRRDERYRTSVNTETGRKYERYNSKFDRRPNAFVPTMRMPWYDIPYRRMEMVKRIWRSWVFRLIAGTALVVTGLGMCGGIGRWANTDTVFAKVLGISFMLGGVAELFGLLRCHRSSPHDVSQ